MAFVRREKDAFGWIAIRLVCTASEEKRQDSDIDTNARFKLMLTFVALSKLEPCYKMNARICLKIVQRLQA